jgi:hypothetical protein
MNEDFELPPGLENAEWCLEQQRLVRSAMAHGWITEKPAISQPVPASESAPAARIGIRKSAVRPKTGKTAVLKKRRI